MLVVGIKKDLSPFFFFLLKEESPTVDLFNPFIDRLVQEFEAERGLRLLLTGTKYACDILSLNWRIGL